jgi:hypothetical protein
MQNRLLYWFCSKFSLYTNLKSLVDQLSAKIVLNASRIATLEDIVANRMTAKATTANKISVSSHAIHRYRERHKGLGTDTEISKKLYKLLLQQLAAMDTLPDGEYILERNVRGIVQNNTLVTIVPKRDIGKPRLK